GQVGALTRGGAVERCGASSWHDGRSMTETLRHAKRVLSVALLLSLAAIGSAAAQTYPPHPIRWIIGFPPAGPTDILVRIMGDWLSNRLRQPVIDAHKPGGASNVATEPAPNRG